MFKSGGCLVWRKSILENNTLKTVIKLPEDLFYPVGVHTSAIIIQKGIPHKDSNVLWGALSDGFIKKKDAMIRTGNGTLNILKDATLSFLNNIKLNNNANYCVNSIDFDKKLNVPQNIIY